MCCELTSSVYAGVGHGDNGALAARLPDLNLGEIRYAWRLGLTSLWHSLGNS